MQDDLVQPKLTVYEAMSYAADFKLGKTKSQSEKRDIIDEILNTLRLSKVRDVISEFLSGGERKRLTIALELVNNPPVIFLDEPTTGLDELSSSQCIDVLQTLAHIGRTVVITVHTPSASTFLKFNQVYVVASGLCVYMGPPNNVVPFLQGVGLECPRHYNPADFVIETSCGEYGHDLTERMVASVNKMLPIIPTCRSKHEFELEIENLEIPWTYQFITLVRRMTWQFYRNRQYMYTRMMLQAFVGLTVGLLFFNIGNDGSKALFNFGFCFASVIVFLFIPLFPVLLWFPLEIQLMKREHFNRWYKVSSYFWALTVLSIPQQIIIAFVYLPLVYFITGQPLELNRCLMFFSTCIVCSFISESIGHSVGSIFNVANSVFVGPVMACPLILFAVQGFGDPTPLPLYRWLLMYFSYIRYGIEGLVAAMYGYGRKRLPCPLKEVYCPYSSPEEIAKSVGLKTAPDFWMDMLALIVILLIAKAFVYYLLRQRVRPNKTFRMIQIVGQLIKTHVNT